ncbi:MAG: hypothetical protein ACIALR_04035, partial [Blastopirellula sp. JB062]
MLKAKGKVIDPGTQLDLSGDVNLVVGVAGQSSHVDQMLKSCQLSVPVAAESLLVAKMSGQAGRQVLVAGRDPRGTAYALLEIAEEIRSANDTESVFSTIN